MLSHFGSWPGHIAVAVLGLLIVEASAQAGAPACAIADDPFYFVLTCAHGDITTESTPDARGAEWLTSTTFTTDDSFLSNKLTIEGMARHIMPPHGEGANPAAYMHDFIALVDGLAEGVYDDSDFEVIVSVGPPIRHGSHFNIFHRDVVLRVGDSDDIQNFTLTVAGRHTDHPYYNVFSGESLLSSLPGSTKFASATMLVDQQGQLTLGAVVSGTDPSAIVAAHIHSVQDGQILLDVGNGASWTNLDGIAAARDIGNDQLTPLAQQLLDAGLALFDVHLFTGEIIQGRLQLVPRLAGDFDFDGDVDGRDFLVWQRGESPSTLSTGDLADWQANYGTGSLASSRAAPEPMSACLLCLALLGVFTRYTRSSE